MLNAPFSAFAKLGVWERLPCLLARQYQEMSVFHSHSTSPAPIQQHLFTCPTQKDIVP